MGNFIEVFKVLSDPSRMQIVKLLLKEEMYVEMIASTLDLTSSTVSFHLKKLLKVGLVKARKDQYYNVYSLNKDMLQVNLQYMIDHEEAETEIQKVRQDDYKTKVIKTFFDGKRLKSIPVQRKKKIIILEELSSNFELGRQYKEPELNEIIKESHEDFCTLRREFIMERFFTRDKGIYTRIK